MNKQHKIPVIYILSNGRSGSTLLDLLLGTHPNTWTLGEAQNLPWELGTPGALCGCGASLRECDFWAPLLSPIPLDASPPIEFFRESKGGGKVLRWRLLPGLWRGTVSSRQIQQQIKEYGKVNAEYFSIVREAAEERGYRIKWLVDASKDVYRLYFLQKSGLFDIRVIHLTKDPRAFVYSMIKRWLPGGKRKALRMTGRWIVENAIGLRLLSTAFEEGQSRLLHYEDLASRPQETISVLGNWLGLEASGFATSDFRDIENHAVSGNKMRWEDTEIRLDDRWKQLLPKTYAQIVYGLTWPVRKQLGY